MAKPLRILIFAFIALLMGAGAYGMITTKYNMCMDAGYSNISCIMFAGTR